MKIRVHRQPVKMWKNVRENTRVAEPCETRELTVTYVIGNRCWVDFGLSGEREFLLRQRRGISLRDWLLDKEDANKVLRMTREELKVEGVL